MASVSNWLRSHNQEEKILNCIKRKHQTSAGGGHSICRNFGHTNLGCKSGIFIHFIRVSVWGSLAGRFSFNIRYHPVDIGTFTR
jgi:hypothetical protein